ncbi:DUF4835 family protein [Maribacter dokdonensis]|uniref:type IX secretion system protein PorD n=1 Tax=Maribacter dokdonensis TaxID=320912 RepID=UPI0032999580
MNDGSSKETIGRLMEHFYEINEGIGVHKSPELYGAFTTDPYSHTPAGKGAQQPGMTGQVKEDILSRIGELGIIVSKGILQFKPCLLRAEEFVEMPFNFQYIEFQPLIFNENQFESNLVSVMAYYAYVILGLDADTFSLEGGTDFYRRAQNIVTQAQGSNSAGWSQSADSNRSRFELIDNLLSNTYREYRIAMYNYHRKGLDILPDNNSTGKQVIAGTMNLFQTMINRRPNAFLISTFFDAKSEEIKNIFSDGPKVDIVKLKETLNKIAPLYATTWNDIKY